MAHILIVESNTPELVAESRSQGRLSEADNYASVLRQINAALRITSVALYAGEALPPLKNVSGVVFTGSGVAWCVDDPRAEALEGTMRAVFAARLPAYGSCNGLQMAAHVLGGTCGAAPAGREDGVALGLTLSPAAEAHPMMQGRDAVFAAVCVHRDEVQTLPAGVVVLVGNGHSKVQAMVYEQDGVCFWGSQYHPEYSVRYVGEILRDIGVNLDLASNMMRAEQEEAMALALGLSQTELGHDMRTLELQNWLAMVAARVAA